MVSRSFESLIGQPQSVKLLTAAIARQRIAPGYLFVGSAGVGRRLAAQGFAELLLSPVAEPGTIPTPSPALRHRLEQGNHPDMLWVEPTYQHQGQLLTPKQAEEAGLKRRNPPQIRLEQIRNIARFLSRPPLEASRAVVVLEDAQTMAESAANGLLKTLEEPGQATLILIAPSVDSLLPTLVSRCQRIPFYRLSTEAVTQILTDAGHGEILQHPEILRMAQGSPGEAIAAWQQLQTIPPEILEGITRPVATLRQALELAKQINQMLDPEAQAWLTDYWQQFLWHQHQDYAKLQALETAKRQLRSYAQPRLVWEVTLMSFVHQRSMANSR